MAQGRVPTLIAAIGAGGNGSDGGMLVYVAPETGLDQLTWVKVVKSRGQVAQAARADMAAPEGQVDLTFCHGAKATLELTPQWAGWRIGNGWHEGHGESHSCSRVLLNLFS